MNFLDMLREGFNNHVDLREKRPGVWKLIAPVFHEDGDMVDIFLEQRNGRVRVSDHGLSLMRLSYTYEIDTGSKERIFRQILGENHVSEDEGNLFIDVAPNRVYPAVLAFAQTVAKICSMSRFKREVIANLFYESLDEFVIEGLQTFQPRADYVPVEERSELQVDYGLTFGAQPIFLFGAKESDRPKVRLIAIACLEFEKAKLPFRSVVVHQNFEALAKNDRSIITNAVDKQFTSLEHFKEHGVATLERLAA